MGGRGQAQLAVGVLALLVVSCGGSSDETTSTETDASTTEPVATHGSDTTAVPLSPTSSAVTTTAEPSETAAPSPDPTTSVAPDTTAAAGRCAAAPGLTESTVTANGNAYDLRIFLPASAAEADLIPTVFVFHGGGDNGTRLASTNGFEELAETEGFAVVHPTADPAWPFWEIEESDHPDRDDASFASELIDLMIDDWCADPAQMYSVGLSIGGTFSARLACEMPDKIAGVGVVAQIGVAPQLCDPALPTPVIQFNGTADPVIPFTGNGESIAEGPESWRWMIETVIPDAFADGAARRGCAPEPTASEIGTDVIEYRYSDCDGEVEMLIHEIIDGGHTWPGDTSAPGATRFGYNTADIAATLVMWDFLSDYNR